MPVTNLAAQLKRLETPQSSLLSHKKIRASFLFDPKEAAQIDRNTFYELGLSGLEELKKLNPQFSSFENNLFDITSKNFERSVETAEINEKLNHQIKTFLVLLSPYFLIKSSHKALEWLINRYHIEEFNVDDILFLILPYHETILFAKMLQLLPVENEKWHWLQPVKKAGVPLSKTAMLNRAAKSMSFLKFVSDMPEQAIKINGNKAPSLGTLFAFYCTTILGALEYADKITELHITHLLPSLMLALSSTLPDFTASAFMIIARLATKATLGDKIFEGLCNKIAKIEHTKLRSEITLVLTLLFQSQKKLLFPKKGLQKLSESPWFIKSLTSIANDKVVIIPFVLALLRSALRLVLDENCEIVKQFVENLLNELSLDSAEANNVFSCLLNEFKDDNSTICVWYSGLLRDLEKSYPAVFDSTASKALSNKKTKEAIAIKTLLGTNVSRNDLYTNLVHTNEMIRANTIKQIAEEFKPDQLGWLKQSLLERMKDDNLNVILEVLNLPKPILDELDQNEFWQNLILIISKFYFRTKNDKLAEKVLPYLFEKITKENIPEVYLLLLPKIFGIIDILKDVNVPESCKLFYHLKTALKNDVGTVWNMLNDTSMMPSLDEFFQCYESKSHVTKYWPSMAFLIAKTVPEDVDEATVNKITKFLLAYLNSPKLYFRKNFNLTKKSLKFHFKTCQKGRLPIIFVLNCLAVLSKKTLKIKHNQQWYDLENQEHCVTFFVFKVIQEGILSNIKAQNLFIETETNFLEKNFADLKTQVLFLLNVAIQNEHLATRCISLIEGKIKSKELDDLLTNESVFVPCLLAILDSRDEIRAIVLNLIKSIPASDQFYYPLIEEIIEHEDELLVDQEQLPVLAFKTLSANDELKNLLPAAKRKSMALILNALVSVISSAKTPMFIKEIFIKFESLAMSLLGKSKILNKYESQVLMYILKRFSYDTIRSLSKEKTWNLLTIGLSDHKTKVLEPGESEDSKSRRNTCPAAILLDQITKDMFNDLREPVLASQEKLLNLIITSVTDVHNPQVVSACASLFKRIAIDCKILVSILEPMTTVTPPRADNRNLRPRARQIAENAPGLEILETMEWKKGVCLLELTQCKKKLSSIHCLLPTLFKILKRCLQFEQQAPVEYTKQLLLSSILHCCERLKDSDNLLTSEDLHVDLVVDCVRASHNPQTHHHALLALTHIAHLMPDQVLHNIMSIFTFIGSSVLRQDDAYSFQIISKVIDTIIPVLIKSQKGKQLEISVVNVCRVFVAAVLDVPEHRRVPLYLKLILTLNEHKYLWIFLSLVFESHVITPVTNSSDLVIQETPGIPKKLETGLQLCAEFPPAVILTACHNLLIHVSSLPHDKENAPKKIDSLTKEIFNIEENSGKQLRHYKYTLIMFISSILSSNNLVQEIADMKDDEIDSLEEIFSSNVEILLSYLKSVLKKAEESSKLPTAKYWKAILNQCYEILDKINALLPTDLFLKVIKKLLNHKTEAIRRKAMEILGWRLQQPRPLPTENLFELLKPLVKSLDSISKSETSQEIILTQQTALFALKLMARHLSAFYLEEFKDILKKVTYILADKLPSNEPLIGSLVLCLGEIVSMLKAHSINHLSKFMPAVINILDKYQQGSDLLLLSIITSIHKILDGIALFISPHLDKILFQVCLLSSNCGEGQSDSQKSLSQKLKLIRQKISSAVPNRVLIPATTESYKKLIETKNYKSIPCLMSIMSECLTTADFTIDMSNLFLLALQFRVENCDLDLDVIDSIESAVISSLTTLVLKLSESAFKPFYYKIYNWAIEEGENFDKLITFYQLSKKLAESLKNLFSLFANIFISNASEILINTHSKTDYTYFNDVRKTCLLLDSVLGTLFSIFKYDSHNFLTKERFKLLMQPTVDQLDNELGGEEKWNQRNEILIPCLAQMSRSTSDDSLWKQLNYQILLKTRHSSKTVRLASVKTVCTLAGKLGEDFLPLLPETVPFLAELLEDDEEEVEKECQRVVNEMEEILGEPIQKYF